MKSLFKELKNYKMVIFLIIILSIISSICTLGIPKIIQVLIDTAVPKKDLALVFVLTGRMLILIVILLISGLISSRCCAYVSMNVGKSMRSKVFAKVQGFSFSQIDEFSTSSLISRTNSDINVVQVFLSECFRIAIIAPILCVVGLIMSIITSYRLSIVLVIALPILVFTMLFVGRKAIPLSNELQIKLDTINRIIREKLTGVRVIRAFGTNDFEDARFDKVNVEYTNMNKSLWYLMNCIQPLIEIILGATGIGLLLIAYFNYINGIEQYTQGTIMAIMQYISLIMVSVTFGTMVLLLLPKSATCANRAMAVLDSMSEIKEPKNPAKLNDKRGYVTFKDVTFTYKGASSPAVKDLSFEAKPGEITAIIGGTGMGKSSIINLIPRLYDVTSGEVLVDDINVKDYKLSDLRGKIGFVPQKSLLFKGTIDTNLAFGDVNPTDERIEDAAKISQSYDFIMKKSKKFDEEVAEGGINYSGGQRQRLCIGRAIVRKPEIYIFDDSFSALDLKTDKTLREALKKETGKDATTIIVAQRVSTIMDADRIIVIDCGEIVGIGKHDELLQKCQIYKEIVDSQISKEAQ